MLIIRRHIIYFIFFSFISSSFAMAQNKKLSEIYKSGNVRLIKEIRINDENLPKGLVFENPRGLAADATGNIYVTDYSADHIKVFDPKGKIIRTIGKKGQGPGDLGGPETITIAKDRIVVREVWNQRLSIFSPNGDFMKSAFFDPDARSGLFMGMKTLPDGRLAIFSERGLPQGFSGQLPLDQNQSIEILSADLQNKNAIYEKTVRASRWFRNPETNSLQRIRFPYHPRICFDAATSGMIAVGYNAKYEIEFYNPEGGRIAIITHPFASIRLEERDKNEFFNAYSMAVIVDNVKKILPKPPEYITRLTEFPDDLPPYRGIMFDSEDNLWVHLYTPGRATNIFDVFSPKGEFIHQITIEGAPIDKYFTSSQFSCFSGNTLWRIERDQDGFASLVKYLIE